MAANLLERTVRIDCEGDSWAAEGASGGPLIFEDWGINALSTRIPMPKATPSQSHLNRVS